MKQELANAIGMMIVGPLATLAIIIAGEGFRLEYKMLGIVVLATVIAIIVNFVVSHIEIVKPKIRTVVAVIVIEVVYGVALAMNSVTPQDKAWLPIALLFLPIYSSPIAVSVSVGMDKIARRDSNR